MAGENTNSRSQRVLAALDEYEGPLTRYAIRMLGNVEAARDVVQHAFLQLCDQHRGQFPDHPKPWLFAVCRNRILDLLKRPGHLKESSPPAGDMPGPPEDPATLAERNDLMQWLRALVDQLPRSQREVIDLWCHGFRYREIAELTNQSEVSVRVTAHRALRRLRNHPGVQAIIADENPTLAR